MNAEERCECGHLASEHARGVVRLIMVGDGARPVEVLVDEFGWVEWKIVGARLEGV